MIHPLSLFLKIVPANEPTFSFSSIAIFLGYVIKGCRATPLAETHDTTVCVCPFSALVIEYMYVLTSNFTNYFARFVNYTYMYLY